ncbi:hypothetical protein [Halobacillus massiliensis]|uniref:hypothetical protein n=1 Tax=Halobacillus massiliensis TaxID=1926286 RepID=UPI0009E58AB9|nr:hypothetical protein [Halobacillus massiliensis]
MGNGRGKVQTTYEIFMIGLAALSVATIWQQSNFDSYIVWGTWGIFFIDFIYRFSKSSNKWDFLKENPFIVIAAIPLDAVFQFARFARILHLLRLKSITKYYTAPFIRFLRKHHFSYTAGLTMVVVFILIIPLKSIEPSLNSYFEALLSSLRGLIFFGRTGYEPETAGGQVIFVIITILGVILHGLIISTAIDYVWNNSFVKSIRTKWKMKNKESENR